MRKASAESRRAIKVLIVDDHPVVREGVASLIGSEVDLVVVGEASHGAEAIERFLELRPDVTLMDIQMPGLSGIEAITAIRQRDHEARILVLTTYPGDAHATRCIRAGAAGYVLKNSLRRDLLDAIRTVHSGKPVLSPEIAHRLALHVDEERLTDRELEVLRYVADGHANKEIAWRLGVSIDTVKAHLKKCFEKLGVDDRAHAVTVATRRGYIER